METLAAPNPKPQDTLPQFPKLTGPIGELVDAITDDIPYEHRAMAALTYIGQALSLRTRFAGDDYANLQSRFYACLIGPPGSGKSAAMKEVRRALPDFGDVYVIESLNSEPALVMALERHSRLLFMPDEASGFMDKAKSQKMFSLVLKLLESNEASHTVRDKETKVENAHFAMVLSATPQVFGDMWSGTGGASSGLQSRFILSFSEAKMPLIPTGSDAAKVQAARARLIEVFKNIPQLIELPDIKGEFTCGLTAELDNETMGARVVDMGRRFALLMAACSGKAKIAGDDEAIQLGRDFIRYQIAVHERFMPADGWNDEQRFVNKIIKFFKTHPGAHDERELRNSIKPERCPGGLSAFKKAITSLTGNMTDVRYKGMNSPRIGLTGELIQAERSGKHWTSTWKLNPDRDS